MHSVTRRTRLLVSSIIGGGLALSALPAIAADAADDVAEIVVTGSRIARPNLESPVPVSVVDSRAIEASGQISTGEIIRQLPAAGVSTITPTNSTFATAGNGITTVNLRNLEESRTLVLVNGRRFVPGAVGTQAVDLNAIPTDLIDRIDVVTGGASSIYGSDALAGVVNIITKQNFEGFAASGQYGISDRDDDKTWKLNFTAGSKFADDKGSAVISFGYDQTGSIYARDRCDQDACVDGANDFDGTPGSQSYRRTFTPVFSGTPPQSAILVGRPGAGNLTFSPQTNGSILPFVTARDGFNRQDFRILQVPSKRVSFSGQLNYKLAPIAELFSEVTYVHNKLFSTIEPTPFASAQLFDNSTPFCTATGCTNGIPLTSASIPNAVKQLVRDANPGVADSDLVVGFRRRLNEVGNRGNDLNRATFRAVTGLRGDLWKSWRYEASLNYGRTDEDQATNGEVNLANLRNALNTTVVNGQTVCVDPTARAAGCVPVNVFGAGSITKEGADYIRSASSRTSRIEEFVLNGYATGELFQLPAGPLQAVIGGEYRREKAADVPDALTQSGGTSGNATPPTVGKFDVSEGFVELRAPLLKGLPFVESLDLNLSGRYSDYSTVNSKTAYAASLEYRPVKSVMFRGQYSRSVRAPNISELFQPASQDFPTVQDPCRGVTRTAAGQAAFLNVRQDLATPANVLKSGVNASTVGNAIATACLSDPTVAARVTRDGGLAISQFEAQSVTGFDGGSTQLNAETAKTLTLGVLFNPRDWGHWWAPLSVSFDYYNIKIRDRIAVVDEQVELDKCYAGGFDATSPFCAQVVRFGAGNASVGSLFAVNQTNGNFASSRATGFDVQASYNLALEDVPMLFGWANEPGSLFASLQYSHVSKLDLTPFIGAEAADIIHEAGKVGKSRDKAQLDFVYNRKALQWTWQANYIGKATLDTDPNGAFFGANIPARWFFNTQVRYEVTRYATAFVGVNNVFDEYVRVGGTNGDAGQAPGWTTFPDVYDGVGRRYYTGVRLRF